VDLSFDIQTAQNVPLALEPASVGERILATVVDGLVVTAYVVLVLVVGFGWIGLPESLAVFVVVLWVPVLLYHLLFEVFLEGRTPGKLALKTQVARLDGAQPTLGQYLLRWLLRLVDVSASSGAVALISVAVTARSQRLGDLAAGTTVVRRRPRVRLGEVLYPAVPPDHEPEFPEAERLSDADVRTLRAVLVRLRSQRRDARATELGRRAKAAVETKLGLGPVRMPPEAFLRAVVRDHTFLLDRYAG
jgi:uncharacterized RDD family membrane protein YckC